MKRTHLNLTIALAVMTIPAASAMNYKAPAILIPSIPTVQLFDNLSGCSSASHTVAVGYESYTGGFRILCADAGDIGFWTTPVKGELIGVANLLQGRFICPSGTALAGLYYVEGINTPFPTCAVLIPVFSTGTVLRGDMVSVSSAPMSLQFPTCGPNQFIQTLKAQRGANDAVQGFSAICNSIQTVNLVHAGTVAGVDLAVRTVGQTVSVNPAHDQTFEADVFNLGSAFVHASNVTLDIRFNTLAWTLVPAPGMVCSDIMVRKGLVDMISLGSRCSVPGAGIKALGGETPLKLTLQSHGLSTLSAPTLPVISIRASVRDESIDGSDGDLTNDTAAFAVNVQ
jgi:hypothetical protein